MTPNLEMSSVAALPNTYRVYLLPDQADLNPPSTQTSRSLRFLSRLFRLYLLPPRCTSWATGRRIKTKVEETFIITARLRRGPGNHPAHETTDSAAGTRLTLETWSIYHLRRTAPALTPVSQTVSMDRHLEAGLRNSMSMATRSTCLNTPMRSGLNTWMSRAGRTITALMVPAPNGNYQNIISLLQTVEMFLKVTVWRESSRSPLC